MTNDLEIGSILEIEPIYEMAKHDSIVPVLGFRVGWWKELLYGPFIIKELIPFLFR